MLGRAGEKWRWLVPSDLAEDARVHRCVVARTRWLVPERGPEIGRRGTDGPNSGRQDLSRPATDRGRVGEQLLRPHFVEDLFLRGAHQVDRIGGEQVVGKHALRRRAVPVAPMFRQ